MKRLLIILSILFPFVARAATYPNYFVTNASPFSVVPGVSMYVPSVYSTNQVTTNLSVTDYLFIGTAQVNYLTMLGAINQQGLVYTNYFQAETNYFRGGLSASNFFGDGSRLTGVPAPTLDQVTVGAAGSTSNNITTTGTNTAAYFFGNIRFTTNSNGHLPAFNEEPIYPTSIDVNNGYSSSTFGAYSSGNLLGSGSIAIGPADATTHNVTVKANPGIVAGNWLLKTNITLNVTNAIVVGDVPNNTTNSVTDGIYVYGTITATGTNTAAYGQIGTNRVTKLRVGGAAETADAINVTGSINASTAIGALNGGSLTVSGVSLPSGDLLYWPGGTEIINNGDGGVIIRSAGDVAKFTLDSLGNITATGNITTTGTNTAKTMQTTNLWLSIPAQAPFPAVLQPISMFGTLRMTKTNLVTTPVGGTYYNVTNWSGYIANGFTANTTLGFVTNSVAGYYRIIADLSFIGANAELYEVCVLTNMVDSELISSKKQFSTPGRYDCVPVSGRMYLYANTAISLAVKSAADTTQITVHRASLDVGN